MCKVSVIIPVYNVEPWLGACLDSVLGQTLPELEVICVDDCSPDRCPQILEEYAGRDPRLKAVHLKENHGQGNARNIGLEMASGKYIYILDSDDMIHPHAMELLYKKAEADSLDGIFFDSEVFFEKEQFRGIDYEPVRRHEYPGIWSGGELFQALYSGEDWNVYVWRQFWRREFLLENSIRFPFETEHEDESFSVEAAVLAKRVCCLKDQLAVHRYRPGSVMTREKLPKDFHGYFQIFRELRLFGKKHGIRLEAFELNQIRLFELIRLYHPLFLQEGKPEKWFRDPQILEEYELFAAFEEAAAGLDRQVVREWEPLMKYDRVFVYGAGKIANRVMEQIRRTNLKISGILVTSMDKNPEIFCHCPVREAAGWIPDRNSAVVIAVSPILHEEIAALLSEKDCDVYSYVKGKVSERKMK